MPQGLGGVSLTFDTGGYFDPRITPTGGNPGTIFRFVQDDNTVLLLLKQDNGVTTNWTLVGGGGPPPPPTGDPNTVAFFDSLGNLSDDTVFTWLDTEKFLGIDQATPIASIHIGPVSPATVVGPSPYSLVLGNPEITHNLGIGSVIFNGVGGGNWLEAANSIVGGRASFIPGGSESFCLGDTCSVTGNNGVAFGFHCVASGSQGAFVGGDHCVSSGQWAFAYGSANHASGFASHAIGQGTTASGVAAFAGGINSAPSPVMTAIGRGSFVFGDAQNFSTMSATGLGSVAIGHVGESSSPNGASNIQADGDGSFALGIGLDFGTINASAHGAFAMGYCSGGSVDGSTILSQALGSFAAGFSNSTGSIQAGGQGSFALGFSDTNSTLITDVDGSFALGHTSGAASIEAGGIGSFALGMSAVNGRINAVSNGSMCFGFVTGAGSVITTNAIGSIAFGQADLGGDIDTLSNPGALAFGRSTGAGSTISSRGSGSLAAGLAEAAHLIRATANGAVAIGHALSAEITAVGLASFAFGSAETGEILASGKNSFTVGDASSSLDIFSTSFGLGHVNHTYALFSVGRFSSNISGTPGVWTSTEPVFVVGNGANAGAPANAYQIDKDGRQTTTASHVDTAIREVSDGGGGIPILPRTDRVLAVDTTAAAANILLPPGENGLEFYFNDIAGHAGTNNITFTPNGGDTVQPAALINTSRGRTHLIFFASATTWLVIGK